MKKQSTRFPRYEELCARLEQRDESAIDQPAFAVDPARWSHLGNLEPSWYPPEGLTRSHLFEMATDSARKAGSVTSFFVACMAWGFGRTGWGVWRTERMLETPDAEVRLEEAFQAVRQQGAMAGYTSLASTCRLNRLGPAFGTKFLYFAGYRENSDAPPLILDQVVGAALAHHEIRLAYGRWQAEDGRGKYSGYETYLGLTRELADDLGVQPHDVELRLFCLGREVPATS